MDGYQSQQAVFDRLNCSKDMKLLKGAGHFPIEKEGLVHLERYCVEFWRNVWPGTV